VRITGWILLLIGLVLCVSVAWAALGFLLMGVGLVALQVAERDRRRARQAAAAGGAGRDKPLQAVAAPRTEEPVTRWEPALAPASGVVRRAEPTRSRFDRPAPATFVPDKPAPDEPIADEPGPDTSSYDKEAWHRLVERDPGLAQLTAVLADYGQPYVDELATRYLAAPDSSRLGAIVDEIIAKARGDFLPPAADKPPIASTPAPEVASSRDAAKPGGSSAQASAAPSPAALATEVEDPLAAAIAALTSEIAAGQAPADPQKANPERGHTPITAADDDLTEMIRKFAPGSGFLRKN
jgi:hypothetical protein